MSECVYLREVVKRYCAEHPEYDALVMTEYGGGPDDACGCGIDDLMPCCEPSPLCQLGHRVPVPAEYEVYTDAWFEVGPREAE